jgi:hypothetical protein
MITMKALRWIAWISVGIGALIILLAAITLITGKSLFYVVHTVNYFITANSFLLLAIAILIALKQCGCCCDKCNCKEEKKEG